MPEKKTPKRYDSSVFFVIIAFTGIIVALIITGFHQYANRELNPTISIRIPVIRTELESANDGQKRTVQTQFYVQIDRTERQSVTAKELEEALSEIMKDMDFDEVAGQTGVDYINRRATEELNRYLEDTVQTRVLLTGIATDDRIRLEDDPNQQRDNAMRGLFQNID
jgi:flagellar basal body-associated protein FliL